MRVLSSLRISGAGLACGGLLPLIAAITILCIACPVLDASLARRPPALPVFPYEDYEIRIAATRCFGVVPFTDKFEVVARGYESVSRVRWDFDADGHVDAEGLSASYTFCDPIDYEVTAEITTSFHGSVFRTFRVSGHTALMTITFDDGPMTIHFYGLPLLATKGVAATAYIVPTWVRGGWYLGWEEVRDLYDAGWVIGSHTMTHANLTQADDATLHYELGQSQIELLHRGLPARHLAVPYGAYDDRVIEAIRVYYDTNRIVGSLNPLPEQSDPYLVSSHMSASTLPLECYRAYIDSAIARRGWYVMCNHSIAPNCFSDQLCISTEMMADIIDYAQSNRVKIIDMDQALEMMLSAQEDREPAVSTGTGTGASGDLPRVGTCRANPGRQEAIVDYQVLGPTHVSVGVFDVRGRLVRMLLDDQQRCGDYTVSWNGTDADRRPVAAGVYFLTVRSGNSTQTRKIPLAR